MTAEANRAGRVPPKRGGGAPLVVKSLPTSCEKEGRMMAYMMMDT